MAPDTAARSTVFTALHHPQIRDAWAEYEARNLRSAMDYYRRHVFREVRRDTERHLYPVPVAS